MPIRITVADNEAFIRDSLSVLLSAHDDLAVVNTSPDGSGAVAAVRAGGVDVAVLDLDMPVMNGLEAAEAIRDSGTGCGVVILTSHGRPGHLQRALSLGVRGFVTKDTPAAQLADVIRTVHRGGRHIDPEIATDALALGGNPLTAREREVLRLVGEGLSTSGTAARLHLAEGTIRNYMTSILSKLGVANKVAAYHLARETGWL
ncbi:LuxR family transcriptional regulator [Streptomyces sp. NRRL F-5755]|uniref:response regulator transcription factor n=1 Tax=Streptomyces sp. NRRL F-5755 TaxID=1519475 RepID=UPI0006AE0197|nr:response regulator transcription factor [Streptomyces sp. NRRL F-5755]KOU02366.1 LuxR family transcriptional regulator [Streptomyces sp. NRRL F-5755]